MTAHSAQRVDTFAENVVQLPASPGTGILARIAEQQAHAGRLSQHLEHQRARDPMGIAQRSPTLSDAAVGREIRELRRAQGRTQKELARVVGVTGAQLHRYEMGTTRIAASRLIAIANALDIRPDVLIAAGSSQDDAPEPAPTFQPGPGDDIVELIQAFSTITDPKRRAALIAVAKMMASRH
ncbi:helix-turn-helix domain-containing protein [Pararoseomonas indoligenes]|uniref:Helix-turn-helix transcriptional regulator n=1 Tax=Roseomonas indoligenes TaxID=2820811 RepID=A0A940N5W2_9PROT|nr:helix-turn-helix transcriptional regulator [Pararoseomonas indoligenes]MBP0496546.1 helix-turn-helix transcriptional regulator [Pararoseomonas indoligenes]